MHDRERAALAEAHRITLQADLVVAELAEQDAMTAQQVGNEVSAMEVADLPLLQTVDASPPLEHHIRPRAVHRGTSKAHMLSGSSSLRQAVGAKSGTHGTRREQEEEEEVEQEEGEADEGEDENKGEYEDDFVVHFSGDPPTSDSTGLGLLAAAGNAFYEEEVLLGQNELAVVVGALSTQGNLTDPP
jgi:hypothetical protein